MRKRARGRRGSNVRTGRPWRDLTATNADEPHKADDGNNGTEHHLWSSCCFFKASEISLNQQ